MEQPRRRVTPRVVGALLAAALLVAACGDDDDDATTTTTTRADTTTSSPTTSTSTTTTEPASDEDQVRALIDEFSTFWERTGDPPDPDSPLIAQLLTDPLRTRVVEGYAGRAAQGYRYDGTYTIDIDQVVVDGDSAVVSACALDGTAGYNPDGSVDAPPQESATDYAFTVRRTEDGWRVSSFTKFEESPCELA